MKADLLQNPVGRLGLRLLVGAVFFYAGVVKLAAPQDFADSIAGFRLLPPGLINLLALGLPPFEVLVGGLLLIGWRRRSAALAALLMMSVFTAALASAWARGFQVDCGCFGSGGPPTPWRMVLSLGRELLLLAATGLLYRQCCREQTRAHLP